VNRTTNPRRSNPPERILRRGSQEVKDLVELIDVVSSFEDRFSSEEFGQDAANRPHVNCTVNEEESSEGRISAFATRR